MIEVTNKGLAHLIDSWEAELLDVPAIEVDKALVHKHVVKGHATMTGAELGAEVW
jgi:hypothetical protein